MQTVLVSALTAAVVTMLIEYAAKPYLEVRKERILDAHRTRRDLISRIEATVRNIAPLSGIRNHAYIGGKRGFEAVDDYLTTANEISDEFSRIAPSLGRLRRKVARQNLENLKVVGMVAYQLLAGYREQHPAEPHLTETVNEHLAPMLNAILIDLLGLRAILTCTVSKPWSYYKTLRNPPVSKWEPGKDAHLSPEEA